MRTARLLLAFALPVVASSACSPEAAPFANETAEAPEVRHQDAHAPDLDLIRLARLLEEGINAHRAANGLPPLHADDRLGAMASDHSADMVRNDFFDHVNPSGQPVRERARAHGLSCGVGENLYRTYRFASYRTEYDGRDLSVTYAWHTEADMASAAVAAWMESPLHRMVLLRPEFTRMGLGIAVSDDLELFITQDSC